MTTAKSMSVEEKLLSENRGMPEDDGRGTIDRFIFRDMRDVARGG